MAEVRVLGRALLVAASWAMVVAGVAGAGWADSAAASAGYSTAVLAAPTDVKAAPGTCLPAIGDQIVVTWSPTAATWAEGYEVARSTSAAGPFVTVATVSGRLVTTFTDGSLPFSTTYHYVVRARKLNWRSADTPAVARTTRSVLCL